MNTFLQTSGPTLRLRSLDPANIRCAELMPAGALGVAPPVRRRSAIKRRLL